jgi:DNA-damage-inducible protein J
MAVSDTYVRARIDNTTKERATAALGAMGLRSPTLSGC